ncbi:MAG: PDZ domain-containing protein [Bacteroidota bacterium]
MRWTLCLLVLFFSCAPNVFSQGTQLLRQPTISTDHIVFVYANDLWKVKRSGGDAFRLTSNEGHESLPHFSPDEKWIAFSAEYGGNEDVYLIPSEGGTPQRLTWHPSGDFVQGWTPEGEVIFRSGREGRPTQTNKLYKVPMEGGLPQSLEIPRAAYGEISPDGQYIAYTPITSWDPEWRNYRGGQAMPIWIVNRQSKALIRTPQPDRERHLDPVWFQNKVYYLSERDYASNIWSFDPASKAEQQITKHQQFDVKSLDACKDAIVYEQGGYLHLLDPSTNQSKQLNIEVRGDMNFARPRWEAVTANQLRQAQLSPSGKRALFEHRGEILTFPKEKGTWRNLTKTSGAADRAPIWSPKGDQIAWFSDASGEYQLIIADQFGLNPKTFDLEQPTFYFRPEWSPDGQYIAFSDTDYNLWVIHTTTGALQKVDTDRFAHPNRSMNPVWSPDSKWVAYARQLESHFKAIFAYQVETKQHLQLTDGLADAITPVWDQNGKYLYFLASTDYALNSGWLDMSSYGLTSNRGLYCLVLSKDDKAPTLVESDEEVEGKEETEEEASVTVNLDSEGLAQRIVALDVPKRNYRGLLRSHENSVLVLESIPNESTSHLQKYSLEKGKLESFVSAVNTAVTSSDGQHLLYRNGKGWIIASTASKPGAEAKPLKMNAKIKIDPQQEYQQIFKEGWRHMRDFLYVDNAHGAPWETIYKWYAPWIKHVRHRTDLNYVVDILSGEVAIGHSYVRGGDMPDNDRVPSGLLGCDLEVDNGFYRIKKIYTGEQWTPNIKAPLATPGLGIEEGDYLLGVNGQALKVPTNPYHLFEQSAGRATTIHVHNRPDLAAAKEVLVAPIRDESLLRAWDWIEGNRKKVDQLSGGKLAYVYVPNTGGIGFEYFNRMYFAQQDKKGVVIDERNNGGGFAADYIIDVISRSLFGFFNSPAKDNRPWTTPIAGIWGPKVMIINERAGSGGDLLPYMFRAKALGPLIGTRTWGGLVGTWDTPLFVDGGRMVAPRGGFFDLDGNWAVEGEGIAPDIEVIQDPKAVLEGGDPQLERAVEEAMRMLQGNEFKLKPEPEAPIRWKRPAGFNVEE